MCWTTYSLLHHPQKYRRGAFSISYPSHQSAERNVITHIKSVSLSQSLNTINHICILGHVVAIKPVTTTTTRAQIRAAANTRSRGMAVGPSLRAFAYSALRHHNNRNKNNNNQNKKPRPPHASWKLMLQYLLTQFQAPAIAPYISRLSQFGIGDIPIHICL